MHKQEDRYRPQSPFKTGVTQKKKTRTRGRNVKKEKHTKPENRKMGWWVNKKPNSDAKEGVTQKKSYEERR